MVTTRRRRTPAHILPDTIDLPEPHPDDTVVGEVLSENGIKLTKTEVAVVRIAMRHHVLARKPRMLWNGWLVIAKALAVGHAFARKKSGTVEGKGYNKYMTPFLRLTGLSFVHETVRSALRSILDNLDEVEDWRQSHLTEAERAALHNPLDIWTRFRAWRDTGAKPSAHRQRKASRNPLKADHSPDLVAECAALEELVEHLKDQLDAAQSILIEIEHDHPEIAPKVAAFRRERAGDAATSEESPSP